MIRKYFALLVVLALVNSSYFPWGDEGHKLIAHKSFSALPSGMNFMKSMKDEIVRRSTDPDYRKKDDKSEGPKHYIDIDFYKEFGNGNMPYSKDDLFKIYCKDTVNEMGLLPWVIQETMLKLENAFKAKDKGNIILYASDLAHYIGDAHQPLHATINYDGKLTGQNGIHARYEITMVDSNLESLEKNILPKRAELIGNPPETIFNFITASNIYCEIVLGADKFSVEASAGEYNKEYYHLLWFRTKSLTERQMEDASHMLASFIYTAWIRAGKPQII